MPACMCVSVCGLKVIVIVWYLKCSICSIAEKKEQAFVWVRSEYIYISSLFIFYLFFYLFAVLFDSFQFRRAVSDVTKPHHDDYYLIRWLNGTICSCAIRNSRTSLKFALRFNCSIFVLFFFLFTARNWNAEAAEHMLREVSWFVHRLVPN